MGACETTNERQPPPHSLPPPLPPKKAGTAQFSGERQGWEKIEPAVRGKAGKSMVIYMLVPFPASIERDMK